MAIFLNQTSTNLKIPAFFSTKRTNIDVFKQLLLGIPEDFCTCIMQCVPGLKVFTDQVGDDFYKNDLTTIFSPTLNKSFPVPPGLGSTTTATITNVDTGVVTSLTNVNHGEEINGVKFYMFIISWFKIQQTLGFGRYRIEYSTVSNTFGLTLAEYCSPVYDLLPYSDKLANGTIRLELTDQGRLNHSFDYRNMITSSGKKTVYTNQVRLPGSLKWESGNEETDHLTLNGVDRPSYQIKDQVRPKYTLDIHLVSAAQFVKTYYDDMFASPLNVSDYNVYNFVSDPRNYQAIKYRSLPLIKESSTFSATAKQKRKSFSFSMKYFNDNIFKTSN